MDFFWSNFFEPAKERRNGNVFLITFGVMLLGFVPAIIVYEIGQWLGLWEHLPVILAGLGLILLACCYRLIRQRRARTLNRYKSSPLSRDEIIKARSKLSNNSNFKKL
jgi:predicted acyltransferase